MKPAQLLSTLALLILMVGSVLAQPAQPTAQGQIDLNLTVKDNQGRPMADTEIEFVETQTRQRIKVKTDPQGVVEQHFGSGRYWQINIKDIKDYYFWQIEVIPAKNFRMTKIITYDYNRYERESRPAVDRRSLGLTTEAQKFQPDAPATTGNGIIKIEVKKANDQPLTNFPIAITCYALRKTFTTTTNPAGIATFRVPLGQEYDIDIDGINAFSYADLPNTPGHRMSRTLTYEPTLIDEKTVRDTTTQNLPANQEGTTGRVLTTITFKGGPDGVWRGEPVFLEVLGDKQVYKATTNNLGQARFLLPKGKKYMIHGRFAYNLDVIDLSRRRGIGYSNKSLTYHPLEKYQYPDRYIPKPEDLIVEAFENFLAKQYPAPEPGKSISIQGKWSSPIGPNSEDAVLNLSLTAQAPTQTKGKPMNICFVIDKSGSMAGAERIDRLKKSLQNFIGKLRPADIASIVIFDDEDLVVVSSRAVGNDRALFIDAIKRIEADGGTYIAKGLKAGYEQIMLNFRPNLTNRLILLSDGYGAETVEETLDTQKPYTAKGIECSTVGVGADYNVALLKQLATAGGGLIEHIADGADMEEVFTRQLQSLLYPVAEDLILEITYNKHLEYRQLYGYPLTETSPGRLKLKLRKAYAGLDQLAFVRFRVLNPQPGIQDQPVTLRLRYRDVETGTIHQEERQVPLVWSDKAGELDLLFDQNEKKMYAIAVMNQSLKVMSDKFHAGDLPAAQAALQDGLNTLQKIYPDAQDTDLLALKTQLTNYLDIISRQKK